MGISYTLEQLFSLPEDVQEEFVKQRAKRQSILRRMEYWKEQSEIIQTELINIRSACEHPLENVKKVWDEDEYGKLLDTGYIDYICPDCSARRSENF